MKRMPTYRHLLTQYARFLKFAGLAAILVGAAAIRAEETAPATECSKLIPPEYQWQPLDWSQLHAASLPRELRIFPNQQPGCEANEAMCTAAESNRLIGIHVDVYFKDSAIWNRPEQLLPYMELVNRYYQQARIVFHFRFKPATEIPAWNDNINQLSVIFAAAMPNPAGTVADAFGNLPAGKAVFNDVLMNRPDRHANRYFAMGKPLGHELGHVLGLAHTQDKALLMTQGTSPQNALVITPEQALIMRVMALQRFGGVFEAVSACN
ncbi:hypothetical protein H8L32_25520 [Undibacterium sp. CY18W]|uniref:Matrixin n=1 Tax=Undibacterium hunanense TaxID=2762292 RepID=A0ABR6ZZ49_9BURK|nr:hypothetical protein [Undibacterium hunanense]MBC3920850.1 hypothetical protein [Undibacterium hunanense]